MPYNACHIIKRNIKTINNKNKNNKGIYTIFKIEKFSHARF